MKNLIIIFFTFMTAQCFASAEFIELAKKTASVYSGNSDIDSNNTGSVHFETLIQDQIVYLMLSHTHLNSSFYTIVNSETGAFKNNKTLPTPPEVVVGDLQVTIDGATTTACDGSDVTGTDTSCDGKKCTVNQLIISSCNESDSCWGANPTTDRLLVDPISEKFSLDTKVDITACVSNNIAGEKHVMNFAAGISGTGGSLAYSLILQNDSASVMFSNYSK